jgi:hypothetical protein
MAFRRIARFSSRLEAETVGHALDQHGIPFLVKSDDVGVFGPGMVGTSPTGATLWIPEEDEARVRELLSCVVSDAGASADEEQDDSAGDDSDERST